MCAFNTHTSAIFWKVNSEIDMCSLPWGFFLWKTFSFDFVLQTQYIYLKMSLASKVSKHLTVQRVKETIFNYCCLNKIEQLYMFKSLNNYRRKVAKKKSNFQFTPCTNVFQTKITPIGNPILKITFFIISLRGYVHTLNTFVLPSWHLCLKKCNYSS